uniref:Nuclear receptor-interacting protein 2 n=1 Tax=Sus scrofa TaxID=9823 RepID=A0A480IN38_PIG
MGQRGQGGGQRDRHGSPQLPGSSNAPSPQGSSPQARSSPLGTAWGGCHWPGSWCRGRKGSSGKGAFSRSTPCSRSMQHWRESRVCSPRQSSGLSTSTTWAEHTTVSWPSCSSSCATWAGGPGVRSPPGAPRTLFPNPRRLRHPAEIWL